MSVVTPPVAGLAADQVAALGRLCARSHLALAVIFGSRSRGEGSATSDLDLLVLPATGMPFDSLSFEAAAQQIVGRPRVDLTVLHPTLSSALAWEALREASVLWEEAPGTYERELASWHHRFLEDAPLRREQARRLVQMFRCP